MNFVIITHVPHILEEKKIYGYAPYVNEMNLWFPNVQKVTIVAPVSNENLSSIHSAYENVTINFVQVPPFSLTSVTEVLKAIFHFPKIIFSVYKNIKAADHIHLRCPGNMGLLGCIIQIAFPNKHKTAKYAGNWDPKSKQPWSYRLQKWILKNTFMTRNMQVLVYGEWEDNSKNIRAFFTATYTEVEKNVFDPIYGKKEQQLNDGIVNLLFVGTLSKGKRPLYAMQLGEQLHNLGYKVQLDMYGEGNERKALEAYIKYKGLSQIIRLRGNQSAVIIKEAYQKSHFLILPSKSEGWPKVVAEAMFWGCIPVSTSVSCVPQMLDHGQRGILLKIDIDSDTKKIVELCSDPAGFKQKSVAALKWSQIYTREKFEHEIANLLQRNY